MCVCVCVCAHFYKGVLTTRRIERVVRDYEKKTKKEEEEEEEERG